MRNKIIFLFCVVSQLFFAQKVQYSGKVIDQFTNKPIFGVSIILNNTEITYSDELGVFEFIVDKKNNLDSISFSHMSYQKYSLALTDFKDKNNLIRLKNSFVLLDEVIVTTAKTSDEKIVDKAIKKYQDIYRKGGYWTTGNYKQVLNYNAEPCGYFEAMGNIYQMGTTNQNLWQSLVFVPAEVRRTKEDSRLSKLISKDKHLFTYVYAGGFFAHTEFGNYRFFEIFHPLNEKGKKRFRYSIKKTEKINGKEYYVISFMQKHNRIKISTRSFLETQGEIWVDKNDYSMLKLSVNYNFEDLSSNNYLITYEKVDTELLPGKIDIASYLYIDHSKEKIVNLEAVLTFNNKEITEKQYGYMNPWLIKHRSFSKIPYNQSFWKKYPIEEPQFKNALSKIIGTNKDINTAFIEGTNQKVILDDPKAEKLVKVEEKYNNLIEMMKNDLK